MARSYRGVLPRLWQAYSRDTQLYTMVKVMTSAGVRRQRSYQIKTTSAVVYLGRADNLTAPVRSRQQHESQTVMTSSTGVSERVLKIMRGSSPNAAP
jgi:hypothetical protein